MWVDFFTGVPEGYSGTVTTVLDLPGSGITEYGLYINAGVRATAKFVGLDLIREP